jgi:gluconate 5-dehydrogenase
MNVLPLNVADKVIVVTGGYGYLGKSIVESLAFHGANVIVAGKSLEKFNDTFENNSSIHFVKVDVADSSSINEGLENVVNNFGKIDVLINNAFFSKGQSPELMTEEDWVYGIEGTLGSVFKSIKAIIPCFKKQGFGKIINVASMYGIVAPDFEVYINSPEFLNPPHYGAAKAGIIQLTKYYASYLGKNNILVNSVSPGPFPNQSVQQNTQFIQELKSNTCLNRIGQPEELAGIFTFLSSNAANFITGQNFIVDGGWTTK